MDDLPYTLRCAEGVPGTTRKIVFTTTRRISMNEKRLGDVTNLLRDARRGNRTAFDRLLPVVYDELRNVAQRQLRKEREGHTLFATALVHEAYIKLVDQADVEWQDRAHFFGIAARAMRQILIDYARRRKAEKRGGAWQRTTFTNKDIGLEIPMDDLLNLDEALNRLGELDERLRRVVEYRFFGGLTEEEIAELLGVTQRTVQRDWVKARAWLYKELYPEKT
jgi:RNA polymerase sigma factor (TIGR02999 family)